MEETGTWKCSGFSLAELWWSLIGWAVAGREKFFLPLMGRKVVSFFLLGLQLRWGRRA